MFSSLGDEVDNGHRTSHQVVPVDGGDKSTGVIREVFHGFEPIRVVVEDATSDIEALLLYRTKQGRVAADGFKARLEVEQQKACRLIHCVCFEISQSFFVHMSMSRLQTAPSVC